MNAKVGFIGGGNMASSLIGGLVAAGGSISSDDLWVFDLDHDKLDLLKNRFNINVASSNQQLIESCDVVVFAIKPQVFKLVALEVAEALRNKQCLIISVVAGIEIRSMERWIGASCPIVRVMPNTPALIGLGASGLYANHDVSKQQAKLTDQLISAVGICHWVTKEEHIDSITALSGSGPAYFMLFIQSLIESAVNQGIDRQGASELAVQTAIGAAELIKSSELSIQTLIDNVTSPNGTTEQALLSFNTNKLSEIVDQAFLAAKDRSREMAEELGE